MFPNKYSKPCSTCRRSVAVGAGFCRKESWGWATYCPAHAPEKIAPSQPIKRELTITGFVHTPYEPENLPLIRSFPGARWVPDSKCWSVSLDMGDRQRVLELADKLGLEVPSELRTVTITEQAQSAADLGGLYPFQVTGVNWLSLRKKALLADEMGLGKSCESLRALPANAAALVICPNVVKYNWQNECLRWRPDLSPVVLSGKDSFRFPQPGELVIVNYDVLPEWAGKKIKGEKVPQVTDMPADAPQQAQDVSLIVDEAHATKNYAALRSVRVKTLAKLCKSVWFLTGTPLMTRPFDLSGVLGAMGAFNDVFGSWDRFLNLFNGSKDRWGGYRWGAVSPEVPERLRRVMLRRTREEVLPDLPKKQYTSIEVNELSATLRRKLDAVYEEWADVIESGDLPPFEEFSSIRAELAESRIPAMEEFVEQAEEEGSPLVVFSAHRKPIDALASREGWKVITGDTKPEERTAIVTDFQAGKLKGIGLTIQAGGVGITLTRASSELFVDLDWTPALNAQAEDRLVRIGQTAQSVSVYRMSSTHVLDLHVNKLISEKIAMIQSAVENEIVAKIPDVSSVPTIVGETEEEYRARMARLAEETARIAAETARIAAETAAERQQREGTTRKAEAECRVNALAERYKERIGAALSAPMTPERAIAIRQAFAEMCANDPDYAEKLNGVGWNKPDASLARHLGHNLGTDAELVAMHGILWKYKRQLSKRFPILWQTGK